MQMVMVDRKLHCFRLKSCLAGQRLTTEARLSAVPLARWRNRRGYGHALDLEGQGGVPRSHHGDVLRDSFPQSVRHGGGALQRILDKASFLYVASSFTLELLKVGHKNDTWGETL